MYLVLDGVPIWTHVSHRILVLVRHSRAICLQGLSNAFEIRRLRTCTTCENVSAPSPFHLLSFYFCLQKNSIDEVSRYTTKLE